MKIFFAVLGLFILSLAVWVGLSVYRTNTQPKESSNLGTPQEITTEQTASLLIKHDDNAEPKADDVRIKRVVFLLNEVSNQTKEKPVEIYRVIDDTADQLEAKFGKRIKRQELLEETKTYFANSDNSPSKVKNVADFKSILLVKYGN